MPFINMDNRFKISKIFPDSGKLILLLFIVTIYKGSNAFGFDSASSCSPNGKASRRGRAQMLESIPCDLTRQPYCNLPGAAYPWHAVRRFVHENQGLMKRMYGDVRHISVLRDEIRNNEIDVDDMEMAAERYSRNGARRLSKYMHHVNEYPNESDSLTENHSTSTMIITTTLDESKKDDVEENKMSIKLESANVESTQNDRNQSNYQKDESNSKINKTINENSTINKTEYKTDDRNLASNSVYELPTLTANEFLSTNEANGDNIEIIESPNLYIELKTMNEPTSNTPTTLKTTSTSTTTTTTTTTTAQTPTTISTTTIQPTTNKITTNIRGTSTSYISSYRRRPQYSNRYRPINHQKLKQQHHHQQQQQMYNINTTNSKPQLNGGERNSSTTPEIPATPSGSTPEKISRPTTTTLFSQTQSSNANNISLISATLKGSSSNSGNRPIQTNTPIEEIPIVPSSEPLTPSTSTTTVFDKAKPESISSDNLRRQPATVASKPVTNATPSPTTKPPVLHDGQLFQDTVKQDLVPLPNMKGVNACPVKEEVVAPFWANNTRGEVLALLNLYPFEQYVHWEKCTHENKQMYCRDGCRCEQQYRLHRLLAYDPHNECRGIFSDWFRFPSCCICKCYNIPMEFRATSRSPRMQSFPSDEDENKTNDSDDQRHPLEIAEEQVKRAIYEHAAEDWYRPRDDYDYYAEE